MNAIDTRRYEMLVRIRDFGTTHRHLFPEASVAPQAFADVTAAIDRLAAHNLAEASASVSARATRTGVARKALLERLLKVGQTARVLAEATPGLDAQFEIPGPVSDPALLTTARQFAGKAAESAGPFIAHGMPATFLADLEQLIAAFEAALRERGMSRDEQVAARARINAAMSDALGAIRKLDVIVANHLSGDPVTRAVWEQDRRVDYPRRARRAPAKPEPAPATEPTASTATPMSA